MNAAFKGGLAVFLSAFFFYFATVVLKFGNQASGTDAVYFVFARFAFGTLLLSGWYSIRGYWPAAPRERRYLAVRVIANICAVYWFYLSVEKASVVVGNMLNMTYPVFTALFSFLLTKKKDYIGYLLAGGSFLGVYLILSTPQMSFVNEGGFYGIGSGIAAAIAVMSLNATRQDNDSDTVMLWLFAGGTIFLAPYAFASLRMPRSEEFVFLLLSSASGIAGQVLLTYGFRFISAVEGGIIGSTRILLAAFLGPLIAGEEMLTWIGFTGALLIFSANSLLLVRLRNAGLAKKNNKH